jgi:hypothetical protein
MPIAKQIIYGDHLLVYFHNYLILTLFYLLLKSSFRQISINILIKNYYSNEENTYSSHCIGLFNHDEL